MNIFLFTRDLRLEDNTGLIEALKKKDVLPIFIFTKEQIDKNKYKSDHAVQYLIESLQELEEELEKIDIKFYCFYGFLDEVISYICSLNLHNFYMNKDYTDFALQRENLIKKKCEEGGIYFESFHDFTLIDPLSKLILNKNQKPFLRFSHFYKKALIQEVKEIEKNKYKKNFLKTSQTFDFILDLKKELTPKGLILKEKNLNTLLSGGRKEALSKLNIFFKQSETPSFLSACHKFGTISIRESYYTALKNKNDSFIRELFWRDFFTYLCFHFHTTFLKIPFYEKYSNLKWYNSDDLFSLWKEGKTGFPIVDAAMRELNNTGYMNNRMRMITASFLTKDLLIDWKKGEKYFAQKLIDYDPAVNNGNWQWIASTGSECQPYFRVFNPWIQQKKFDKECIYIKKWVKELDSYTPQIIHSIYKYSIENYNKPCINHDLQKQKSIDLFKKK